MEELSPGDIGAFHLTNGTTVIAKVDSITDDGFEVTRPMEVRAGRGPEGLVVGMMPYLSLGGVFPGVEKIIMTYDILILARPAPEALSEEYTEQSGIVKVARQSLIVPA